VSAMDWMTAFPDLRVLMDELRLTENGPRVPLDSLRHELRPGRHGAQGPYRRSRTVVYWKRWLDCCLAGAFRRGEYHRQLEQEA
jgi:hypothetical protein